MYNFEEIDNLNEMKEVCFLIKAFDEAKKAKNGLKNNYVELSEFIQKRYNLEISVSKLYLFEKKIQKIVGVKKPFPTEADLPQIVKEYLKQQKKILKTYELKAAEEELKIQDPKYKVKKNVYFSSAQLVKDFSVKKTILNRYYNNLVITSVLLALLSAFAILCVLRTTDFSWPVTLPTLFEQVMIIVLGTVLLWLFFYVLLHLMTYKQLKPVKLQVRAYYKYKLRLDADYNNLRDARRDYAERSREFFINGMPFSDELLTGFLLSISFADKYYFDKKFSAIEQNSTTNKTKENISKRISSAVLVSKKEQDIAWQNAQLSKTEKTNINKEIVARLNNLAKHIKENQDINELLAKEISDFYCKDLSLKQRTLNITESPSKYALDKYYVDIINQLLRYENSDYFKDAKIDSRLKRICIVSDAEKQSFTEYISDMCNRIEKAIELDKLSSSQVKSYKKVKESYDHGIIYGQVIGDVITRYDLCSLFIKLYEELDNFDILN